MNKGEHVVISRCTFVGFDLIVGLSAAEVDQDCETLRWIAAIQEQTV
jgi:hypothetical protein